MLAGNLKTQSNVFGTDEINMMLQRPNVQPINVSMSYDHAGNRVNNEPLSAPLPNVDNRGSLEINYRSEAQQKNSQISGDVLKFKLLTDEEISILRKRDIEEINNRYKKDINTLKEHYYDIIDSRRNKVRNYIKNKKHQFQSLFASVRRRVQLETTFINQKTKEHNYYDILYAIKLWVFSVIGEIKKNTEVARRRIQKEKNSIATLHQI